MKLILKSAKIIDRNWEGGNERVDIVIRNGKIEKIGKDLQIDGFKEIRSGNLHVSPGFVDIGAQIGEPGFEQRDDIHSISKAAMAGGYTAVSSFPNTNPVVQSKSEIAYLKNQTSDFLVDFHPIGAISHDTKGGDIAEIMDMQAHGAVGFSDGKYSIANSGLMMRALQYAKACDGLIINHPNDAGIAEEGQIHEGEVSVSLGLEGIPEMSETMGLKRDLQLNQYVESKYCAHNISSADSTKLLKKERKHPERKVWSTVNYMNLIFTDEDLKNFNVNLKVYPPLRSARDQRNLVRGLKEGTIDAITTGHTPLEEEHKKMSFAFASFGAIGLETAFSALLSYADDLSLETIIDKLTWGPREVLQLPVYQINEGEKADLCIFDPDIEWNYTSDTIKSKSRNSPFVDKQLKGKVLAVINNNKVSYNN